MPRCITTPQFYIPTLRSHKIERTNNRNIYEIMYTDCDGIESEELEEKANENEIDKWIGISDEEKCEKIRSFWISLNERTKKKTIIKAPLYGSDVKGSLFPNNMTEWNINNFKGVDSLIHKMNRAKWMDGIHTSFLYFGTRDSAFAFHFEDCKLNSISYNHYGAPKIWYGIAEEYGVDVERMVRLATPNNICSQILQHKSILIKPEAFVENQIPYTMVCSFLK